LLPVGQLTKVEVRRRAAALGLRTADKPDSQDVCFIRSDAGRTGFLAGRLALQEGTVVDGSGSVLGAVPAVQLVTIGQRRGLGTTGGTAPRYVLDVDVERATVTVGHRDQLLVHTQVVRDLCWVEGHVPGHDEEVLHAQTSAHGRAHPATVTWEGSERRDHHRPEGGGRAIVRWLGAQRRVAPGQAVVFYRGDAVVGGGLAV
jgi:tRNA-specific 2-thiouridylase